MEVLPGSSVRHFGVSGGPRENFLMDEEHVGRLDVNDHSLHTIPKGNPKAYNLDKDNPVLFESPKVTVDTTESDLPSESKDVSESTWTEKKDDCAPVWVKRKDQWQVGVICKRADWPLDAVKVKPNDKIKKYVIVFFQTTKNYSWVDTLVVRPISERPQPILYSSNEVGLKISKDLTAAGRFIMLKLKIDILDIIDRLHLQVLVESARDINELKKFASVASHCKGYPDIGRMLVKLQKMLLQQYFDGEWLQDSYDSWQNQCQVASSADAVELLKEELVGSIRWKEINSAKHSQETLGYVSEWKICKHEVVELCSASNPISTSEELDKPNKNSIVEQGGSGSTSLSACLQISHKRPKLSIRRAEAHIPLVENKIPAGETIAEIDSGFFVSEITEPLKSLTFSESTPAKDVEMKPVNGAETNPLGSSLDKSRKCKAFIEAKGRQCVRWANEGDEYCCVHLAARFSSNSVVQAPTPVDSPLCGGTTTLGTRCKHRALPGSSFCKKHRPRDIVTNSPSSMLSNQIKRKYEDLAYTPESVYSNQITVPGGDQKTLHVDPTSVIGATMYNYEQRSLVPSKTPELLKEDYNHSEALSCIGLSSNEDCQHCLEVPKRHSLYCENHIPSWLKRARNGKSRIISKEVFIDLLKGCSSRAQKMHLHKACELFYKLFKSILSMRNQVPREIQFQWVLSEASKDPHVAVFLTKLVSLEKARITRVWGFGCCDDNQISPSAVEEHAITMLAEQESDHEGLLRCKFCSEVFGDDQDLGNHCIENHNKEAQWHFRGYACSICLDSFTNRKVLESHVQERHHAQFSDHCMLFRCIPCGSHFGNSEQLWSHVLSSHTDGFRRLNSVDQNNVLKGANAPPKVSPSKVASSENISENQNMIRKFICQFCGLKFDLLPDLGRHHQAAHMRPNLASCRPPKKGVRYYVYRLKSGRLTRPKFKKGIGAVSYNRLKNKVASGLKKRFQASNSVRSNSHEFGEVNGLHRVRDTKGPGRLAETECLLIAKTLFSEVHKTKARPNNHEILSIARTTCCKLKLQATLEEKYGVVPERLYLKAAKLCSEHYIQVNWHQESFSCPRGCRQVKDENKLPNLIPPPRRSLGSASTSACNDQCEKDEGHYVISSKQLRQRMPQTNIILCDDISFGKEIVPIMCVIDKNLLDSLHVPVVGFDGKLFYVPWEGFSYITRPVLHPSLSADIMLSMQLECSCEQSVCAPETCDHVYLFNTDHEDAKDISGQPMLARFPYNENGQLILEDGHTIYECNHLCKCSKNCPNRVVQNSTRVKLEVFKTIKRGWGVRAHESISRGTFVCELVGEVIDEEQASERRKRRGNESCSYIYNVGAQIEKMGIMIEEKISSVIDASKYGNVSRFINHSCSPNLTCRLVLIESMEYQLGHIGLYAKRDIAGGDELTFDYACKPHPGEGQACFCGSSSCRGPFC